MAGNEKIRSGFHRVAGALGQRPAFGLGTGCSKATVTDGLTVEVHEGSWTLKMNLEAAGFSGIQTDCVQTILHYDNDREALGAAFDGGPVALAYHKFTDDVKEQVHADYLTSIAPFKNGDGYDVPGEFVVASAVR
ncbi:MAG TPA: hypothetical protein VMH27_00095 [Puia sp.]|nr:hypothetical protein [Puia sp.]